jgi:hypothetical protein
MPDDGKVTEPARKPARTFNIPPFKTIIEQGNQEIMRQANALVDRTLDSATAVDPKALRKLGDDGARYFFKRLKARVREQVGAATATRATPRVVSKVAEPAGVHPLLAKAGAIVVAMRAAIQLSWKAVNPKSAKPLVVAAKNWKVQQRHRSSYVIAAIIRGLLVALIMTIGAIVLLRLLASSHPVPMLFSDWNRS